MLAFVLGVGTGALVGFVTGGVLCLVEVKSKDLRDSRLLRRGVPLPKDRVTPRHYHWVFMVLGALYTLAFLAFGSPWLLAALGPLVFAAVPVLVLAGNAVYTVVDGLRHE